MRAEERQAAVVLAAEATEAASQVEEVAVVEGGSVKAAPALPAGCRRASPLLHPAPLVLLLLPPPPG